MEQLVRILLVSFGIYRISSLISSEEGLYLGWPKSEQQIGIFKAIRIRAGAYDYGPNGEPETNLGRGISCPLCVGVYVAAFVVALVLFPSKMGDVFLIWMGLAGGQTFLESLRRED